MAIKQGKNKSTWIMNEVILDYGITSELLMNMIKRGIIIYDGMGNTNTSKKRYYLTEKGDDLLDALNFSLGVFKPI
jgi:predicted transcriptional regulator